MNNTIKLLDFLALVEDLPERGLYRGQVGTVVEKIAHDAFIVKFSNDDGCNYAMLPLLNAQLIVLHYALVGSQLVRKS